MMGTQKLECEITVREGRVVWDLNGISKNPLEKDAGQANPMQRCKSPLEPNNVSSNVDAASSPHAPAAGCRLHILIGYFDPNELWQLDWQPPSLATGGVFLFRHVPLRRRLPQEKLMHGIRN